MSSIDNDNIVLGKHVSRASATGIEGERFVLQIFTHEYGWPVRHFAGSDDRGLDLEVSLPRGEHQLDTGVVFWVQVKSVSKSLSGAPGKAHAYAAYPVPADDLAIWIGRGIHAPVLLVLYSSADKKAYWVEVFSAVYQRAESFPEQITGLLGMQPDTPPSQRTLRIPLENDLATSQERIERLVLDTYQEMRKAVFTRPEIVYGILPQSVREQHRRLHNAVLLFQGTRLDCEHLSNLVLAERTPSSEAFMLRLIRSLSHVLARQVIHASGVQAHVRHCLALAAETSDHLSLVSLLSVIGKIDPAMGAQCSLYATSLPIPRRVVSLILSIHRSLEAIQEVLEAPLENDKTVTRMLELPILISTNVGTGFKTIAHSVFIGERVEVKISEPKLMWDCTCDLEVGHGADAREVEGRCPIHGKDEGYLLATLTGLPACVCFGDTEILTYSGPVWPPSRDTFFFMDALNAIASRLSGDEADTIIDIGCGTGVLGIHAKRTLFRSARIIYFDKSVQALQLAKYNHYRNFGTLNDAVFIQGNSIQNLYSQLPAEAVQKRFLICTPPYLPYPPDTAGHHLRNVAYDGISGLDLLIDAIRNWQKVGSRMLLSASSLAVTYLEKQRSDPVARNLEQIDELEVPLRIPIVMYSAGFRDFLSRECGLQTDGPEPYHYWHRIQVFYGSP